MRAFKSNATGPRIRQAVMAAKPTVMQKGMAAKPTESPIKKTVASLAAKPTVMQKGMAALPVILQKAIASQPEGSPALPRLKALQKTQVSSGGIFKKGGTVKSSKASSRADGCAAKGKTKGKMV